LGNLNGKDHSEELGVDGNILEWVLEKSRWESVDWIQLAKYRENCRAIMNTAMNLRFP